MSSISRRRQPKRPTAADLRRFAGFFGGDESVRSFKGRRLGLKITQVDPKISAGLVRRKREKTASPEVVS